MNVENGAELYEDSFEVFCVLWILVEDGDGYFYKVGVGVDGVPGEGLEHGIVEWVYELGEAKPEVPHEMLHQLHHSLDLIVLVQLHLLRVLQFLQHVGKGTPQE